MGTPRIVVADPADKGWEDRRFLLWFGAVGPQYVLAYGSLDDALEKAAAELERRGLDYFDPPEYGDFPDTDKGREEAETDLTYTESGWIPSWEWGIARENPTNEQLRELAHGY